MDYCTNLKIKKSKFDLLLGLLKEGNSIKKANEMYGTNLGEEEDIFSKIAYFEDGSYTELLVYTGAESIMCSLYLYKGDEVEYVECDEGFVGDYKFELNGESYNVCISAIDNEFIIFDNFSDLKDNHAQEYFSIECNEGSIDVLKNKNTDIWLGIIHYNNSGDLLIPNVSSVNPNLTKQRVCYWYNENFKK